MISPRVAFAFVLICSLTFASALKQASAAQGTIVPPHLQVAITTLTPSDALPSPYHSIDLIDTTDIIHRSFSDSMRSSLQTLRDLETKPSCYKIAAAALIHSCSTLDGSVTANDDDMSRGADFIIHDEINIYAARLAVCELSSAKVPVPTSCISFVPTVKTAKKTSWAGYLSSGGPTKPRQLYPEYDEITEQGLEQCLNALHSSNQAWTSFTSSKQNAAIMCHSMRGEIERDHEIHLHKILSSVTEDVVVSLHNSKEDWRQFKADYNELTSNMHQWHLDLVEADEQRLEAAQRIWAQWQADVQDISNGVQQIRTDVDQAHDGLQEHNRRLQDSSEQASGQITNLAVHHRTEMRSVSEETVALRDLALYLVEIFEQSVIKGAINATQNLQLVNLMASNLTGSITGLHERLHGLKDAVKDVDNLKTSVESLSDVLNGNWMGAINLLETGAAFAGYAVVYSLLSVGFWQRFTPFPGNVCASLASGLVLAYTSTVYCSPLDAIGFLFQLLSPVINAAMFDTWPTLVAGIAALIIVALGCLHRLLVGSWVPRFERQSPNDIEISLPVTATKTFRLPINDPKYVAEMVERQIQQEASGARSWDV
ncbi:hypothetical protein LTR08_007176 [Meristemomyces frigidus]|nr:hypothetical protein LTR08_007176 [Meristemomyces frigidus]